MSYAFRSQFARQEQGFGGWGGWGREDNNIHVTAFGDHAQNTDNYIAASLLSSLYNTLRKDVEQDTLSQASMYSILRKDVEQNKLSQASMLLASMPKSLVFTAILPLCTTYCARSAFLLCKAPAAKETYQTFKIERVRAAPLEADGITCSDLGESEVQGFRRVWGEFTVYRGLGSLGFI